MAVGENIIWKKVRGEASSSILYIGCWEEYKEGKGERDENFE